MGHTNDYTHQIDTVHTKTRCTVTSVMTPDERLGEIVQRERKSKGMSQSDLARAMTEAGHPMHQQTVLKIEKGVRPLKLAEALALTDALGMGLEEFHESEPLEEFLDRLLSDLHASRQALHESLGAYFRLWQEAKGMLRMTQDAGIDPADYFIEDEAEALADDEGFAKSVIGLLWHVQDEDARKRRTRLSAGDIDEHLAAMREREAELMLLLEDRRGKHPEAP